MERALLDQLMRDRAEKRPVVLATNLTSGISKLIYPTENIEEVEQDVLDAVRADKSATVDGPDGEIFLNVFNPPLRLILVGAVHISQPLCAMATEAGYEVIIVDPRRAFATSERFPGVTLLHDWPDEAIQALKPDARTAIVTLTHDPKLDDPALSLAIRSPAFYIGALGSRKTHAARRERLRRDGFEEAEIARIHGPVGLSIGAKSPAEIAISILAQATDCLRRQPESG